MGDWNQPPYSQKKIPRISAIGEDIGIEKYKVSLVLILLASNYTRNL